MDKYMIDVLNYSSKLDAMIDGCGEVSKLATPIVEQQNLESTMALLRKVSEIADYKKYSTESKRVASALKDSLVRYYGHIRILEICNTDDLKQEDNKSLPELLEELNSLAGLRSVKEKVNDLIIYQKVQKMRRKNNLHTVKSTLHLAFAGNPGTGKTTVARIVGRVYKQIGLLSKGHFVEVSRTDLIAGYQGQTALKVKKVIEKAKGGVLFIDEAYSITENDHSDSYGRECLTELTKALEDYRDDLVVIVAGYTEPMRKFFDSNPGLKSRFNTFIEFEDYTADELECILESMCRNNDYILSDATKEKLYNYLSSMVISKDENFANGRMVRNLYDDLVMNHARRVINIDNPERNTLSTIMEEDVRVGAKTNTTDKQKEIIDTIMFAPCGMNCKVCYKHCYHEKPCAGCLNSDKGKPEHCRRCKIKDCIKEKGLNYCFECSDYPCKLIKNIEKSYNKRYQASLMANSEFVQKNGLKMFMAKQKEKYTCPKCGGIISIHDRECSECQEKIEEDIGVGVL